MEDDYINNEAMQKDQIDESTDLIENLSLQLSLLNNKFEVIKSLREEDNFNNDHNQDDIDSKNTKKIEIMMLKLKEKDELIDRIQQLNSESEMKFKIILKNKDLLIDNLRRELDLMKYERNGNYNESAKSKFSIFNMRKAMHSNQNSLTSVSTMSTCHDDKTLTLEKINNEKISLEKQLIECKLKYAEVCANLNDLEGQHSKLLQKLDDYEKIIKLKTKSIKKLSEERDHYKYDTNPHYSFNSCDYQSPDMPLKPAVLIEFDKKTDNVNIVNEYIQTVNTPKKIKVETKTNFTPKSGSLISYIKNTIFKTG